MASQYSAEAEAWLYDRLSNDATLGGLGIGDDEIYDTLAPKGTSGTIVTYQYQGGFDINASGLRRLMGSLLFAVKVSGENVTKKSLGPVAAAVDDALQVSADFGGYRFECQREQELALPPVTGEGGVISREIGGLYRILVHRV